MANFADALQSAWFDRKIEQLSTQDAKSVALIFALGAGQLPQTRQQFAGSAAAQEDFAATADDGERPHNVSKADAPNPTSGNHRITRT